MLCGFFNLSDNELELPWKQSTQLSSISHDDTIYIKSDEDLLKGFCEAITGKILTDIGH